MPINSLSKRKSGQCGAALITSLVILLVLTVLGISAMRNTGLQEDIVGNVRDHDLSLQAAESALTYAENNLSLVNNAPIANAKGSYGTIHRRGQLGNLASIANTSAWSTTSATQYPSSLGLSQNPSYVIEFEQVVNNDLSFNSETRGTGKIYYRITARGFGKSKHAQTILQEVYGLQRY